MRPACELNFFAHVGASHRINLKRMHLLCLQMRAKSDIRREVAIARVIIAWALMDLSSSAEDSF
jgi:hypothetical protein